MKFRILEVFSRSASFELINTDCYYTPKKYTVTLDNSVVVSEGNTNVFSLYSLEPNTTYSITVFNSIESEVQAFTTEKETAFLNVRDFGAVGDGITVNTSFLQAAIACCPEAGTVYVPAGVYLSGPIFLKSKMTFYLEKNTVILGLTDRALYPILPGEESTANMFPLGTWEGDPNQAFASLLTGISLTDVNIIGEGTLDANGQNGDWWENVKAMRIAWRPRILFLNQCKSVRIQGVTFANSYSWTIHPYYCDKISLVDFQIKNNPHSPNTDGVNPESCHHVEILGARISVGDDCIALKSGKIHMATTRYKDSRNIVIRNCYMERGHGAVVIGSEIACGIRDVTISQCLFENTDRGLRIKTRRGRGEASVIDDIHMENIVMDSIGSAFTVNMFYFCDADGHSDYVQSRKSLPVDERTPKVGKFSCKNIVCTNVIVSGGYFEGLAEQPIEEINFENISISFAPKEDRKADYPIMADNAETVEGLGFYANQVGKIVLKNIDIIGQEGETFCFGEVKELLQY